MSLHVIDNLCAGKLLTPDGQTRLLVLNRQRSGTTKDDPGDLAYYLFDGDGKFVQGGVYAIAPGRTGAITGARIEEEQIVTVTFGGMRTSDSVGLHFALTRDELILQDRRTPRAWRGMLRTPSIFLASRGEKPPGWSTACPPEPTLEVS